MMKSYRGSPIRYWYLASVWILVVAACSGSSGAVLQIPDETRRELQAAEERAMRDVFVTDVGVGPPRGYFLLIRNRENVCAIRFTSFRIHYEKQGSNSKDLLCAAYDLYRIGDRNRSVPQSSTQLTQGILVWNPWVGHGSFEGQRGKHYIDCGELRLAWWFPTQIQFYSPSRRNVDTGAELAPTKWTDIQEIDSQDPRLIWYRMDTSRSLKRIPVTELW